MTDSNKETEMKKLTAIEFIKLMNQFIALIQAGYEMAASSLMSNANPKFTKEQAILFSQINQELRQG